MEPWKTVMLDTSTMVRQHTERISVENETGDNVDLLFSSLEDADCWVEAIMMHIEDRLKWGKAASGNQAVEVSEVNEGDVKPAGIRRLRQKTASKLMLFYNRISSGDLMERNRMRDEKLSSRNR